MIFWRMTMSDDYNWHVRLQVMELVHIFNQYHRNKPDPNLAKDIKKLLTRYREK